MKTFISLLLIALAEFALADTVNFSYDSAGRLTGVTHNGTNVTSYRYDVAGNLTRTATSVITDTDGDGMADAWEQTYFGNLGRNGLGDFDGDGMSDLAEYLAGTLPNDPNSLLRMVRVVASNLVETTVSWVAISGRVYRVQFKNTLNDAGWNDLPGDITATNTLASKADLTTLAQPQRYYRVCVIP